MNTHEKTREMLRRFDELTEEISGFKRGTPEMAQFLEDFRRWHLERFFQWLREYEEEQRRLRALRN